MPFLEDEKLLSKEYAGFLQQTRMRLYLKVSKSTLFSIQWPIRTMQVGTMRHRTTFNSPWTLPSEPSAGTLTGIQITTCSCQPRQVSSSSLIWWSSIQVLQEPDILLAASPAGDGVRIEEKPLSAPAQLVSVLVCIFGWVLYLPFPHTKWRWQFLS